MSLVQNRDKSQKTVFKILWLITAALIGLAGLLMTTLWSNLKEDPDIVMIIGFRAVFLLVLMFAIIWTSGRKILLSEYIKPKFTVLWLRKFSHDASPGGFHFGRVIEGLDPEFFRLVTLGDQKYGYTRSDIQSRQDKKASWIVIIMVIFVILVLGLFMLKPNENIIMFLVGSVPVVLVICVLALLPKALRERKRQEQIMDVDRTPLRLEDTLQDYEGKKADGRIFVYRSSDEDWKAIVKYFLGEASVVLFDLSEMNENMMWEFEEIFQHLKAYQILFAYDGNIESKDDIMDKLPEIARPYIEKTDEADLSVFRYSSKRYDAKSREKTYSHILTDAIYGVHETKSLHEYKA